MKFENLALLLTFIWIVPILIVFYLFTERSRRRAMERFAGKELLDKVTYFYSKRLRTVGIVLTILAVLCMVLALARPQWGFQWKENKRKGLDIVFGIDTSRSMLATDFMPDRLDFVKTGVADFVRSIRGDRLGLIVFSGSSFLQCPLTVDYRGYLLALKSVSTATISRGGTALSSAIREAVRCYAGAETPNRVFILISDGEHHEGDIDQAIALAKAEKIRIYTIGIGSVKGTRLYVSDAFGNRTAVKDAQGNDVITRLNETTLRKIASETGGEYVRATPESLGLLGLYERTLSKLEKRESTDEKIKVYQDKFQYPIALACVLLLAELVLRKRE